MTTVFGMLFCIFYHIFICSLWCAFLEVTCQLRDRRIARRMDTEKLQHNISMDTRTSLSLPTLSSISPHSLHNFSQMVPKGVKWCQAVPNFPQIIPNGLKWSQMLPNGFKCSQIIQNYPKWSQRAPKGPKWFQMVSNGPKLSQIVPNNAKLSQIVANDPKWDFQQEQEPVCKLSIRFPFLD